MRTRPMLVQEDVRKMMAACEDEARKHKWNITVAIVDEAGYTLALSRMDGAGLMTSVVAVEKARTAALSKRPTRFWEERIKDRPVFMKFPENLPITGGVPLMVGGDCVGAIGVSGVQSDEDEQIALAGSKSLGS